MHRAFLNVGYELNENQLRTHFTQFGSVSDTYLPKHSSGRNKGFGFVTFESAEALERALLTPVHVVDSIVVQVSLRSDTVCYPNHPAHSAGKSVAV